jgi:hypothetical protein
MIAEESQNYFGSSDQDLYGDENNDDVISYDEDEEEEVGF